MNLVLQGAPIGRDDLSRLAALTNANHIVSLGDTAVRLTGVQEGAPVEPFCSQHGLDFAWVPDERQLAQLRLLALDMDSTLVAVETIDEMGAMLGIKDRIATVTAQAMRGEIDYAESLRRRVALLAGLEEAALGRVLAERMPLSPGAAALIRRCRENGIRTLLVSGGFTVFTESLKARLGIDEAFSNTLEIADGRLTGRLVGDIVDARGKAQKFVAAMRALGATRAQTVAVGDGANDLLMLAEAGVSVAWRAKPVVRERATHALDHAGLDGVLNLYL